MRKLWTRVPWDPSRLLALAAVLALVWLGSLLVGGPSAGQSLICDVGGSCSAVYTRSAFQAAGVLAGLFSLIVLAALPSVGFGAGEPTTCRSRFT
jgi:hypothetical protein